VVLWELSRQDGLSQSHLVERMCVQPPTVSKMLDRMEIAGLVRRSPDPADRRGVIVALTADGRSVVDAAMADLLQRERALLAQLPPGEQDDLADFLRRLLAPFER